MADTERHTFQVLTKRHERLAQLASELDWPSNVWVGVSTPARRADVRRPAAGRDGSSVRRGGEVVEVREPE